MPSSIDRCTNIAENLLQIQQNISKFTSLYARTGQDTGQGTDQGTSQGVQLLAVSKTRPASDIRAAYSAGQRCFGENYLQEALQKIHELSDLDIEWHFIGAIQSNKTHDLATHFSWIHSVDRFKIAHRLSQQRAETLPALNICLQVNISQETSKAGVKPDELAALVEQIMPLPNIKLRGLMAIPASSSDFTQQRSSFKKMFQALHRLQLKYPQMDTLSMGMSNDIEAAIAEGSTMVRIGTAIFGARNSQETSDQV